MKKLFAFVAAAFISVAMFASREVVPSNADLGLYATGTYTMCIYNGNACNGIVLTGTYSGWSSTVADLKAFQAVEGFDGWYVVSWNDTAGAETREGGVQAKPIHLDGLDKFRWDYQLGADAELIRGTADLVSGMTNEVDIKNIAPGIIVIDVKSWKNNPCTAIYHFYNITLISPDCNEEEYITPAISGDFNIWAQEAMTMNQLKTAERQNAGLPGAVFEYSVKAAEGSEFRFRSAAEWGVDWSNQLKEYDDQNDEWTAFKGAGVVDVSAYGNLVLGEVTDLVFNLGNPEKYSWDNCWLYSIKTVSSNSEWGTTAGDTSAWYGEQVQISAVANHGYHFVRWNDYDTSNPRTITVTQNAKYTAIFAKNKYSITKSAINGYISGDSQAEYLDNVTLEAIPNEGYHFTQWGDGVTINPRTIILTQDTAFTAEFAANTSGQCGDNLMWSLTENELTIIGTGAMWDGQPWRAFGKQITQINFPKGITTIGSRAFENCEGLTSISIPSGVTSIGTYAFAYCSNLTEIIIPKTVNNIGSYAFSGCDNITSFEGPVVALYAIPRNKVRSITINGGVITDYFFSSSLERVNLVSAENTWLPARMFNGYVDLKELVLPAHLTFLDYMAVAGCLELKGIVIPASVTEIDRRAFEDCRSLSSLTFEEGSQLTTIGSWAFYNCHELAKINLPEGVTEIGKAAFYGCAYAQEVHLPASVRSIGDNGFALCSKIKRMDVDALLPPEVEDKTFYEVSENAPVYVPDQSVNDYKSHPVWGKLNIIGRSDAPTAIDNTTVIKATTKIIRDGQILIIRGNKTYTLTGQEVK